MKKFRKILQSAISMLMAFVLVFSVGCAKESGDKKVTIEPAPEKPAPTFELNKTQIDCIVGDLDKLAPKSLPDIGQATLVWRSENSNIATVDSTGNIEAISEGTTKIVATYGSASAECTVKVSWDDEMPQIISPVGVDGKFTIIVGQDYTFVPTVNYRGKTYNDGQLNISVSDSTVLDLEQSTSTITGLTNGVSNVTISGYWRGREALRTTFNVSVSGDIVLSAADKQENIYPIDQIELYTDATTFENISDQPTYYEFVPTAKIRTDIDSQPIVVNMNDPDFADKFNVTLADAKAIFNQTDKQIEAVSFGDTIATINFDYEGQTYVKQFNVHLERPTANFDNEVKYFSSLQGTLRDDMDGFAIKTLQDFVYGDQEQTIVSASIDGEELQVEASTGAILGVTGTSTDAYETVMTVGTSVEQYNVPVTVYGQYVYEATDLDVFVRTAASPSLDVYVELARDLDLSDYVRPAHFNDITAETQNIVPNHKWSTNRVVAKGFMGTFDGKGHYLMNYTQKGGYGFFEGLYEATIKNVGFVNCASEDSGFLATFAKDVQMENVYIKLNAMKKSTSYWPVAVIANQKSTGGLYKNVYIDLEQTNLSLTLEEGRDRYYWEVYSAFLTFPLIEKEQPTLENCLVISKAPISAMGYVDNAEGPRFVVAENMPEEDRVALRQQVWKAQTPAQQNLIISTYKGKFTNDKLGVYPSASAWDKADGDLSLYMEYYNNNYLDNYGGDEKRASLVGYVPGVRSYNSMADMKADPTIRDYMNTFSSEFWTVIDGQLNWGKHPANLKDGDVFLDVGILAGKDVQGIGDSNPISGCEEGQTIELGTLSCFGYIFTGWKDAATGELIKFENGKYIFTYNGKATILIAQWEKDPDVQVDSGIK